MPEFRLQYKLDQLVKYATEEFGEDFSNCAGYIHINGVCYQIQLKLEPDEEEWINEAD